jgi:sugar lactone lactonase YvrE
MRTISLRVVATLLLLVLTVVLVAGPIFAQEAFPATVPLPNGFQPEGIVTGFGSNFYVGSLANGAIYEGSYRTGMGGLLVEGAEGKVAVGLEFDRRDGTIFAAGGATGTATLYDAATGNEVAAFQLAEPETSFINDVAVTRDAAYFTDSQNPRLFKLALERNGRPAEDATAEEIAYTGDWEQVEGFDANGIEVTRNGRMLLVINSTSGTLYLVNPRDGAATAVDVGGADLTMGDGMLRDGNTLYIVRNRANEIAVLEMGPNFDSGELVNTITNEAFRVPTTIANFTSAPFADALYAVNARFGTEPGPDVDYDVVRVEKQ